MGANRSSWSEFAIRTGAIFIVVLLAGFLLKLGGVIPSMPVMPEMPTGDKFAEEFLTYIVNLDDPEKGNPELLGKLKGQMLEQVVNCLTSDLSEIDLDLPLKLDYQGIPLARAIGRETAKGATAYTRSQMRKIIVEFAKELDDRYANGVERHDGIGKKSDFVKASERILEFLNQGLPLEVLLEDVIEFDVGTDEADTESTETSGTEETEGENDDSENSETDGTEEVGETEETDEGGEEEGGEQE